MPKIKNYLFSFVESTIIQFFMLECEAVPRKLSTYAFNYGIHFGVLLWYNFILDSVSEIFWYVYIKFVVLGIGRSVVYIFILRGPFSPKIFISYVIDPHWYFCFFLFKILFLIAVAVKLGTNKIGLHFAYFLFDWFAIFSIISNKKLIDSSQTFLNFS